MESLKVVQYIDGSIDHSFGIIKPKASDSEDEEDEDDDLL